MANRIEPEILRIVFGVVLALLAITVLYHSTQKGKPPTSRILDKASRTTVIRARDGNVYSYIGAQIGPRLSGKVPPHIAERVLGLLFLLIGTLVVVLQVLE